MHTSVPHLTVSLARVTLSADASRRTRARSLCGMLSVKSIVLPVDVEPSSSDEALSRYGERDPCREVPDLCRTFNACNRIESLASDFAHCSVEAHAVGSVARDAWLILGRLEGARTGV